MCDDLTRPAPIRNWMRRELAQAADEYRDSAGEWNPTRLAEDWAAANWGGNGPDPLADELHPAWEEAIKACDWYDADDSPSTACDVCGSLDVCCDDGPGGDWSRCKLHCDVDHDRPAMRADVVYYPQG